MTGSSVCAYVSPGTAKGSYNEYRVERAFRAFSDPLRFPEATCPRDGVRNEIESLECPRAIVCICRGCSKEAKSYGCTPALLPTRAHHNESGFFCPQQE